MSFLGLKSSSQRHTGLSRATPIAVAALGAVAAAQLSLSSVTSGDYAVGHAVAGDNAGPAIDALIHGHISTVISQQPLMGLTSLLLRAPFAGAVALFGGGNPLAYRVGAMVCLLPFVALATWLAGRPGINSRQRLAGTIAAVIVLVGPATAEAVQVGHPEEVLAATLATGAVLAAMRGRTGWTWLSLGLAVGAKQWALLAAPCVLLALPERRVATAVKAAALALVLSAALPLADPAAFARADSAVGGFGFTNPFSLWWPVGRPLGVAAHAAFIPTGHLLPFGITRSVAAACGLVLALGGLWLYWARSGGRTRQINPLALLAFCGLVRCLADPDPLHYYFVALLIPLAAWETVELGRLPVVTALAMGAAALLARGAVGLDAGAGVHLTAAVVNALSIAWGLVLAFYLARSVVHPRAERKLGEFSSVPMTGLRQGA
ncbi:MAG: hypothetical protein ACR2JH_01290 [Solirubrobacteraceae bacterium]